MFTDSAETRLLVLGRDPDTDLLALLRAWYPQAHVALERGGLADWLGTLWHRPPSGLVLFGEGLDPAALQAVSAWLHEHPRLPALLVTGARGLIGAEQLLGHPALRVLPTPWTVDALRQIVDRSGLRTPPAPEAAPGRPEASAPRSPEPSPLRRPEPAPPVPLAETTHDELDAADAHGGAATAAPPQAPADAFSNGFLDGLVERFRDPLASLSGYLQLLNADSAASSYVAPALDAARELDGALDLLHLASAAHPAHPARTPSGRLAVDALKEAQRSGDEVQFACEPEFLVRVDARLAGAALRTGRLLLDRFGGGGELRLTTSRDDDGASLGWELCEAPPVPAGQARRPPAFLRQLFERLAARVDAEAVVDTAAGGVPRSARLRWPAQRLVEQPV